MTILLRIPQSIVSELRMDLRRPHAYAFERVGFLYCKQSTAMSAALLLAYHYEPIRDDEYIPDTTVGARFNSAAIRRAMQTALQNNVAVLHVHLHEHSGKPCFSRTDTTEMQALMPCFVNVQPNHFHGALVLSDDSACARVWSVDKPNGTHVRRISFVGAPMTLIGASDGE